MQRTPEMIAAEIMSLVSELAALAGASSTNSSVQQPKSSLADDKIPSGATGGIRLLVSEGKLDTPKKLPEVIEMLRQEGRHYSNPTVSMGLLNLVRERVLTRLKESGDKNWKYATRN